MCSPARRLRVLALTSGLSLTSLSAIAASTSPDGVWQVVPEAKVRSRGTLSGSAWIRPTRFAPVLLDGDRLAQVLSKTPHERTTAVKDGRVILLPTPDGTYERFVVVESKMMASELAAWMAENGAPLKTYIGQSLDSPGSTVYLDFGGPLGFHAQVLGIGTRWLIDPYWRGDTTAYASYRASDLPSKSWICTYVNRQIRARGVTPLAGPSTGGNRREYRLAVAAQGEYTAFFGGTVPNAIAAITNTVNRVNQIYERDISVRLILIGNNNLIVYTNPATDPYAINNCDNPVLNANQVNIDAVIGTANYDVGHVVNTGGGGLAGAGPCLGGSKAAGCTGTANPVGDPYDIDYFAHEMGHQFGANHTFDAEQGSCAGGTRSDATAYEPGSGVTILGYAGICPPDNVLMNTIAMFSTISLDEILTYIAGSGTCNVPVAGVNPNAPTVSVTGGPYTIPRSTPFELTADTGADADGDVLTYSWEQFDLTSGSAGTSLAAGDTGTNPIFRDYLPVASTTRVFPANGLTGGAPPTGETLPTTTRALNWRVIVRDNRAGGGRVGEAALLLNVNSAQGPFAVTFPNGGESISGTQNITWNPAGTTDPNVEIRLSTDGGATYPIVLAASTPNDGAEMVGLGANVTTQARIKIKAVNNVYFDVSNADFAIPTVPVELMSFGAE